MKVHSGFICKSHKRETVQMSSNKWMNKQTVVHNTMESYSAIKKDEQLTYTMTWMSKKKKRMYAEWKKPNKKYKLNDTIFVKYKQIYTANDFLLGEEVPGSRELWEQLSWLWWVFYEGYQMVHFKYMSFIVSTIPQ